MRWLINWAKEVGVIGWIFPLEYWNGIFTEWTGVFGLDSLAYKWVIFLVKVTLILASIHVPSLERRVPLPRDSVSYNSITPTLYWKTIRFDQSRHFTQQVWKVHVLYYFVLCFWSENLGTPSRVVWSSRGKCYKHQKLTYVPPKLEAFELESKVTKLSQLDSKNSFSCMLC